MYISKQNIEVLVDKIDLWVSFGKYNVNDITIRGYLDSNNILKFANNKEQIPEIKSGEYYYFLKGDSYLSKLIIGGYKDVMYGNLAYKSYIRKLFNEIETFYRSRGYDTIAVS